MAFEDAILKFVPAGVESVEKGFVSGWASAPVIDRSRDLILGTAVDTSFYRPNPVVLWCHNRTGLPIGRSETPGGGFGLKTKQFQANGLDGLWHDTRFNLDDEFAAKVYGCYQSGFLKGWSMGFIPTAPITRVPHEITKRLNDSAPAKFFPSVKLFEYSAVPIPDNQLALSDARFKALGVPSHLMPLVERWTPPQSTFGARYPGSWASDIRESVVDVDPATLPEFTGQLILKAAKKGGGGHWVTINGHHVYIGEGGTIHPGGPGSEETSHADAHKAASEGKATKGKPKGKKLVEGKEHKGAANAANKRGEQAIREASEARKAGDHEKARSLRAAAYGHFKAAQHHDDGNHLQAAAATKTAHEFASGKRTMPGEKKEGTGLHSHGNEKSLEAIASGDKEKIRSHFGIPKSATDEQAMGAALNAYRDAGGNVGFLASKIGFSDDPSKPQQTLQQIHRMLQGHKDVIPGLKWPPEKKVTKQFPAPAPQSPASREASKMTTAEELVPLTPAPVEKAVAPDPIQELRDRIDALPELIEKSIQSGLTDAVEVLAKVVRDGSETYEKNLLAATELQLETMGKLARVK